MQQQPIFVNQQGQQVDQYGNLIQVQYVVQQQPQYIAPQPQYGVQPQQQFNSQPQYIAPQPQQQYPPQTMPSNYVPPNVVPPSGNYSQPLQAPSGGNYAPLQPPTNYAPLQVASPSMKPTNGNGEKPLDPNNIPKPYAKEAAWKSQGKFCFSVIMTTVILILAIIAYAEWNDSIDDLYGVTDNWTRKPILAINLRTSSCDAGWELYDAAASISYEKTTESDCTTDSNGNRKCKTTTTTLTFTADTWRGTKFCVQRGSLSVADRPTVPCPSGYKICGTSDCVATSDPCPITAMTINVPGSPTGNSTVVAMDGTHQFVYNNGLDGNVPIVDMQIAMGLPCRGNQPGKTVPINQICDGSTNTGGTGASVSSREEDTRYIKIDTESQNVFLADNAGSVVSDVLVQATGYNWAFSYRPQIRWDSPCDLSRQDIIEKVPKIKSIATAQLALLIFTIIASVFNYYATCIIYKEARDDDPTNDNKTAMRKKLVNIVIDIIVIIPTLVAIIIAYQNKSFFVKLKNSACSDAITNKTFGFVGDKIDTIAGLNVAKFAVSFLYLLYRVYSYNKDRKEAAAK